MNHNNADIEEFLCDKAFRDWILDPTPDLDQFWKKWLQENPKKNEAARNAGIVLKSLGFQEDKLPDKERLLLLKRIKDTNSSIKSIPKEAVVRPINTSVNIHKGRKKRYIGNFFKYAAIVGGAIFLALSMDVFFGAVENKVEIQNITKINKKGQKSTIFLPDGTVVTLNSSSSLVYPEEFTTATREVKLDGEAFFQVTRNNKPFIVKMKNLEAKVLGTSFNARAFPEKDDFSISLVTGKVEVYPSHHYEKHMVLYPGEKAVLTIETETLLKSPFNVEEEILWKDGILFFDKAPFKEALQRMEKWYGVQFKVDLYPQEYFVTGKFDNESLEAVLRSISFTLRFDYKINGNKVNINFKK